MKPARVLVTGSSGCLGHPLAQALARAGREVVGFDIAPPRVPAAYEDLRGDVGDVHRLYALFQAHRFDAVVHCGGISGQMVAPDDPYLECEVNVFGTVHLLEAARRHGVAQFVYCSSQAAYGNPRVPVVTESTPFDPTTVYGATKGACDLITRSYRVQHGLNVTTLRIGRVYGPGRRTRSIIAMMLEAASAGRPLRLPVGGIPIQYVYDADIVAALALALDAGRTPIPAYNVTGPGAHTDEEVAAMVRGHFPSAEITFDPGLARGETAIGATVDYSAATRDLGYVPRYDLAQGIAAYVAALRAR